MPRPWAQKLRSFLSSPDPLWKLTTKEEAMKVQAKYPVSSPQYMVIEESQNYFVIKDQGGRIDAVSKADYEPVQEWVDVTAECSIQDDGCGRYCLYRNGSPVSSLTGKYRVSRNGNILHKVEVKK